MTKIQENANPAAVGWRWTTESGAEWEIVWTRTLGPWLMAINTGHGWSNTTTARGIPVAATLKEARQIAHDFVNGTGWAAE
jgi:hypothetical protein